MHVKFANFQFFLLSSSPLAFSDRDEQRWMARGTEEKYSNKRERVQEYRM